MGAEEMEGIEERLKSFLSQLQTECGILNRLVYKNKNQHRRSSYFQYLLKVRRDLKLLQSAHIEDLMDSFFNVVTGRKAKQKIYLLESLKRRKYDNGKYNILERLLGVARLLSLMVEPILRAAVEISRLLARSFFMGFSLTVLALLARLRILIQQMLLDVVALFNEVSSISRKKQSVKITQDGIEVFREYYPPSVDEFITLECVWETDKFVLFEKLQKTDTMYPDGHPEKLVPPHKQAVKYQSLEAFLGVGELRLKKALGADILGTEENVDTKADQINQTEDSSKPEEGFEILEPPSKKLNLGDSLVGSSNLNQMPTSSLKCKSVSRNNVAFISVKKPAPALASASNMAGVQLKETESSRGGENRGDHDDPFFSLLTSGTTKGSLI